MRVGFVVTLSMVLACVVVALSRPDLKLAEKAAKITEQLVHVEEGSILASADPDADWTYSGSAGPANWGNLSLMYRKCGTGGLQSPIDIEDSIVKAKLFGRPPLRWTGYEDDSSLSISSTVKQSFAEHGYKIELTENAPKITLPIFTQYLDIVPISKVQSMTFSLKEVRFKTPSEHTLHGERFPCEVQFFHECSPTTQPSCPATERMVLSVMLSRAFADLSSYGMSSPPFLADLISDMRISNSLRPLGGQLSYEQTVPPPGFVVVNEGMKFRKWIKTLSPYLPSYYEYKGSLTIPPCSEGATWIVLQDALPAAPQDLDFIASQGSNARPLQAANGRVVFEMYSSP